MAKSDKPNILFIMADDIGWFNVSCYNLGVMGYRTPNIDRSAREGAMFTDFYGQRAARPAARRSSPGSRRSGSDSARAAC
jgi:arylsulfatase A-like enzyme